jgi:hypothetical protein
LSNLSSIIHLILGKYSSFDNFIVVEMPLLTTPAGRFCFFHVNGGGGGAPTITVVSYNFNYGGTVSAEPYINFTSTNGTSYSWYLYESETDVSSPTQIDSGFGGTPSNPQNITSLQTTVVNYWYYFQVTLVNDFGSVNYSNPRIQNNNPS